jgi:hypothetical protein
MQNLRFLAALLMAAYMFFLYIIVPSLAVVGLVSLVKRYF